MTLNMLNPKVEEDDEEDEETEEGKLFVLKK